MSFLHNRFAEKKLWLEIIKILSIENYSMMFIWIKNIHLFRISIYTEN